MDTAQALLDFSAVTGVAGLEHAAANHGEALLAPYGRTYRTPLGSVVCVVKEPIPGRPHILLDAHMDEIGMIVTYSTDEGFLRVANCGGVDRRLLLASPVLVHTKDGSLPGVICSIPPHLQGSDEKKNPKIEEIHIDLGLSAEECRKLVRPGDRVTLCSYPTRLLNGLVSGKALDDRAGCISLLKALEFLDASDCDIGLSVVFSTQEEVGGQGAKTAAWGLAPTHAIVVDVSFAHTPDAPRERCGLLSKGPMIGFSPILSPVLSARLIELAKEREIPYQIEAMGGSTGTNADAVVTAHGGVRTALLSIPQKYMHTPVEVIDPTDVDNTGRLIAALISDIAKEAGR